MPVTTCVFDAYGTLFDVAAAARIVADQPGQEKLAEVWPKLAADWRSKQLQYTWLRAVTGNHTPFWQVTKDGLDWAMEASGLDDPALRETLLALYWELPAYPEVPKMLATLKAQDFATAILSNGSPDMLDGAVDFAGIRDQLDAILSVEDVGVFKPARAVYDMVGTRFGADASEVLFVSSNGWDAACGAAYGFHTSWVNRADEPKDRLPGRPTHILSDLTTIPDLAGSL
ncbi:MAG: haloacid dehalogenase type II [Boseongicola sp.]